MGVLWMSSAVLHKWQATTKGPKTLTSNCGYCGNKLVPSIQDSFTCLLCKLTIHRKCLMKGSGMQACTNVDLRNIKNDVIMKGHLDMALHPTKKKTKKAASTTEPRYLLLTAGGVLYVCKDEQRINPKNAIIMSNYSDIATNTITETEREIIMIPKSQKVENTIFYAKDEDTQMGWKTVLGNMLTTEVVSSKDKEMVNKEWFNLLTVKVFAAKELPAVHLCAFTDSYCVLSCEYERAKTITKWNDRNPTWDEQFRFEIQDTASAVLKVFLLNQEILATDPAFGVVMIPVNSLTPSVRIKSEWYPIAKPIGYITGHITLNITRGANSLQVTVVECRNLPAADPNGKSDPYVKLSVEGHKTKTKIVKKNLNPIFNEEFTFPVGVSSGYAVLQAEVYDWNLIGSNDYLGQCYLHISCLEFPLGETRTIVKFLEPKETESEISAFNEKQNFELGKICIGTSLIRRRVHGIGVYTPLLNM